MAVLTRTTDPAPAEPGPPSSTPRPSSSATGGEPPRAVQRLRLAAVCLALTTLMFVQDPGRLAGDTKLDLLVDPAGLLGRALHMWEPLGFLGQVQNQGYGYLFPMGPFFLIGDLLSVPDWIVQRAWWSLLVCAGFLGVVTLARTLGIGTSWTRILAGLAYVLAPRAMTTLGPISVEALPMMLAPWALVPLVRGANGGSERRAGLLSGVVLLLVGGVNAAATAVVLVLPALYLLTRTPGPRRRRLVGWWALGAVLASLWWALPLLLLGRFSPPFLDYIEDASVTTLPTNLAEVLRGADHWVAFVAGTGGPAWFAGWLLVTTPVVIAYTGLVAATGLAGLSSRELPERTWLAVGAGVGVLMVTFGHLGPATGLLAEWQHSLLDGPLAPLRNVHKYDPVLRLVLVLALAHAVAAVVAWSRRRPGWHAVGPAVAILVVLGVVGSAFPALVGRLAPGGTFAEVPGYWEQAARFVARADPTARTLVVPGAPAARMIWGNPRDEPLQAFGLSPWAVRDSVPLTPGATIRMLDAIQTRLAAGQPIPGLGEQLAAMGVRFLLVRNDLDTAGGRAALPSVVHESLRGSTGITYITSFGGTTGGQLDDSTVVDRGLSLPYPAVEIYEATPYESMVSLTPLSEVPEVVGAPEDVVAMRSLGLVGPGPAVLAGDAGDLALGDAFQGQGTVPRELNPGFVDDNTSAPLAVGDPLTLERKVRDYRTFPDGRDEAQVVWDGEVRVTASSQASDADEPGGPRSVRQPLAAMDADPATAWWSSVADGAVGAWYEVDFGAPIDVSGASLLLDDSAPGPRVTRVRVTTDAGETEQEVTAGEAVRLQAPTDPTRRLRVTAVATDGGAGTAFGIRELAVPGIVLARTTVAPGSDRPVSGTVVTASASGRPDCVHGAGSVVCTSFIARAGEEQGTIDRYLPLGPAGPVRLFVQAAARPGSWLDETIDTASATTGATLRATATSSDVIGPQSGPRAAVDRDLSTAWRAASDDRRPALVLSWDEPRRVIGIQVRQRLGLNASRPLTVAVRSAEGQVRSGRFDRQGRLVFATPLVTDELVVSFPTVQPVLSFDPYAIGGDRMPVGVSDVVVMGAGDLQPNPLRPAEVTIPCGEGPVVRVDDRLLQTRAETTLGDLVERSTIAFRPCQPVVATGAPQRLVLSGAGRWTIRGARTTAAVQPADEEPSTEQPAAEVVAWDPTDRVVALPDRAEPTLLVVRENLNPGWTASLEGQVLPAQRVDGWAQGWVVPAGSAGDVVLTFGPDRWYRLGLLAGLLAALALVVLALLPPRDARVRAATGPRRVRYVTAVGLVAVAFLLVGGPAGLALGAAAVIGARLLGRTAPRLWPWAAGASAIAAMLVLAVAPWGTASDYAGDLLVTQLLALTALAFALTPYLPRPAAEPGAPDAGRAAPPAGS